LNLKLDKILEILNAIYQKLELEEIIKKLKGICQGEKIDFDESALLLIAQNSEGSLRDAESLIDQCISFFGKKKK